MDLVRFNWFILKQKVSRRTTVLCDNTGETQVKRCSSSGVDTHMAHGAANGQGINLIFLQSFQQVSVSKTVRVVFLYHLLLWQRGNRFVDIGSVAFR
jgi:hypothetical protein